MKDIDDIRRENLRTESVRLGGDAELARVLQKDKNQIYQWIRADDPKQRRTMRKPMARLFETRLLRDQGWLDIDHSNEAIRPAANAASLPESRSKNDMRALRFAVQSLFAVLHEKMPDEAEDVAVDIVETAGTEFAKQGFLNILLGNLRGAEHMTAEERLAPRPVQALRASKRAVSGAKKT